jgi:hypothetical protein
MMKMLIRNPTHWMPAPKPPKDLRKMFEKKPIESAPTDGTEILIWNGLSFHVAYVLWWEDEKPVWFNGDCRVKPIYWTDLPNWEE